MVAMPDKSQDREVDNIYRALVKALPDQTDTLSVVAALGMLLSAVIIERAKPGKRAQAAQVVCDKIRQCCEMVPSLEEIADGARPTRH